MGTVPWDERLPGKFDQQFNTGTCHERQTYASQGGGYCCFRLQSDT